MPGSPTFRTLEDLAKDAIVGSRDLSRLTCSPIRVHALLDVLAAEGAISPPRFDSLGRLSCQLDDKGDAALRARLEEGQ